MAKAVAIIPARGGSKRIPRKNIRDFAGKPAIAWPIEVALASGQFAKVVVSTDDQEIADCANRFGAETPFLRDASLSDDYTGTTDVVRDAVERLGLGPDVPVCCIYATALFVSPEDLQTGYDLLAGGATWSMTVSEYPTPIARAYHRKGDALVPRHPDKMPMRSQDLEADYFDVGQFYWAKAETWLDPEAVVWDGTAGVEVPALRAVDIDTEEDWKRAEFLMSYMQAQT
ncbi:MAG: pseudaminic acid cytidylyltransferase [Dinoroseobacter sp.]|nr:pseudaminic acid cytidylyltransferase [Dinoroseobacter sp.]